MPLGLILAILILIILPITGMFVITQVSNRRQALIESQERLFRRMERENKRNRERIKAAQEAARIQRELEQSKRRYDIEMARVNAKKDGHSRTNIFKNG